MQVLIKEILVGYNGGDKYKPEGIDNQKEYRVVAMIERTRVRQFEGKDKEVSDVFFYVVNDNGKMVRLIDSNVSVRIPNGNRFDK